MSEYENKVFFRNFNILICLKIIIVLQNVFVHINSTSAVYKHSYNDEVGEEKKNQGCYPV